MRKILFSLTFVAASLFAADFTGASNLAVVDTIKSGDVKSFAEAGFELSKRVSVENQDAEEACLVYGSLIKKELAGKTPEQKRAFRNEFDMYFYENFKNLSKVERDNIDRKACYKYADKDRGMGKGIKGPKGKGMNQNCPKAKGMNQGMGGKCMMNQNCPKADGKGMGKSQGRGMNPNCPLNDDADFKGPKAGMGPGMGQGRNAGMNPNCPLNNKDNNSAISPKGQGMGQGIGQGMGQGMNRPQGRGMGQGMGEPKCTPNTPCAKMDRNFTRGQGRNIDSNFTRGMGRNIDSNLSRNN